MFIREPAVERGVSERDFVIRAGTRDVPGVLWMPDHASDSRPLVLLGHGGSGHKRQNYITSLARRAVRHLGYAAAAIDGPMHGDRAKLLGRDPGSPSERRASGGLACHAPSLLLVLPGGVAPAHTPRR